jgi:hypothetical protein
MSDSEAELEKRVNREWAVPNQYDGFPAPVLRVFTTATGWEYTRAFCPVTNCPYEGLPHGFNQHYARAHAPDQWRQHAKRVIRALNERRLNRRSPMQQ